jgi:hypothetical protein
MSRWLLGLAILLPMLAGAFPQKAEAQVVIQVGHRHHRRHHRHYRHHRPYRR